MIVDYRVWEERGFETLNAMENVARNNEMVFKKWFSKTSIVFGGTNAD